MARGGCTRPSHPKPPSPLPDGGITDAISMLASTIFWIIYVIVVLVIFQVDFNAVFVPLSTLVLGRVQAAAEGRGRRRIRHPPPSAQALASPLAPPSSASLTPSPSFSLLHPLT